MTDLINLTPAERQQIVTPAQALRTVAETYACESDADYSEGARELGKIKAAQKALAEKKMSVLKPLNQALAAARLLFKAPEEALEEAEGLFKRSMIAYSDAKERERREAQRAAEEAAAKERDRLEREAKEREARAAELREQGKEKLAQKQEAKADQAREVAAAVVAPVIQSGAPGAKGVSTREYWYAVITDLMLLVKAVAEGKVPLTAVMANEKFLNNQARAMQRQLDYPGVRACRDTGIAARASHAD